MPESTSYLNPALLATVGQLELRARMVVEGLMTGMHRSPMQGVSVEFAQHRPYVAGDDVRFLDWKVFGRTDKLYLKQYQKETNLDLVLLVDRSGSMGYGGGSDGATKRRGDGGKQWRKFDHAATIAAALAYLALQQQDRVGLTLFDHDVRVATRLSNNQAHWRSIVEALSGVTFDDDPSPQTQEEEATGTDFAGLFDRVLAKLAQRSLIVLISDLFDEPGELERGLAKLYHRRHDVIVLQPLDPAELTFPFRSPSDFRGLEGEGRLPLDPTALREGYLQALRDHRAAIEEMTRRFHFDYLVLDTSESVGPPLSHFLAHRTAMMGKR